MGVSWLSEIPSASNIEMRRDRLEGTSCVPIAPSPEHGAGVELFEEPARWKHQHLPVFEGLLSTIDPKTTSNASGGCQFSEGPSVAGLPFRGCLGFHRHGLVSTGPDEVDLQPAARSPVREFPAEVLHLHGNPQLVEDQCLEELPDLEVRERVADPTRQGARHSRIEKI